MDSTAHPPPLQQEGDSLRGQMMEMLKYLRLAVCVVCIAAFASGCGGGGGGGSAMEEEPPVMECPQGQVGTYPDCMDPPSTDAELIADARQELSNILTNAQARAGAASSAATAIQNSPDATPAQITDAISHSNAAQNALALIVSANTAATLATTPAEANAALGNARAAQGTLDTSASAISSIQGAVQAAANQRQQREADAREATNGSSLIQHLRDNKLLADAVRDAITADSIVVGAAGNSGPSSGNPRIDCAAPCAEFPADIGTGADRVTGQLTVRMPPTGTITSDSTTPSLTGTRELSSGRDMKNADGTTFVNAYTDIAKEGRTRKSDTTIVDDSATDHDERYDYIPDTDYLLAGIWLTVDNAALGNSRITAFAYGGQPIVATSNFCSGNQNSGSSTSGTTITNRVCGDTTGLNTISTFVKDGQDVTATYDGNANGAYLAGSDTSYFTADVTLTAEFRNPTGGTNDGTGSIVGEVTNIVAGGQQMAGSIELQEQSLGNNISAAFESGTSIGVVDGKSFSGSWKGQFFGMRVSSPITETDTMADTPSQGQTTRTITTTYSPQHPGSVAGTFYATKQSAPAGDAAFIGSFAADR